MTAPPLVNSGSSTSRPGRGRALGRAASADLSRRAGLRLALSTQTARRDKSAEAISEPETAVPLTSAEQNARAAQRRPDAEHPARRSHQTG